MRIAINARALKPQKTGIGNYISHLITEIAKLDRQNQYVVFYDAADTGEYMTLVKQDNFEEVLCPQVEFWEQICLPTELEKRRIDLYHSTAFVIPLIKPCPMIVTFHDLTYKLFPDNLGRALSEYYERWAEVSAWNADCIISDSDNTARDLMKFYHIPREKIETVLLAVSPQYRPLPAVNYEWIRRRYRLRNKYVLFVGTIEPRKNLERMLEAFRKVKQDNRIEHQLVLVGKERPNHDISKIIKKLGIEEEVRITEYVPDTALPLLYNAADVFVYVSLYEGFGLPPLEAMSCGTPVITSNTSSLPEVVGDAAITVNPYDVDEIANAMYTVLTDDALKHNLIARGIARSQLFSWEKVARETLSIYEKVKTQS